MLTMETMVTEVTMITMHYGIRAVKREEGVCYGQTGLKIFVFINAMIFAFITFVTNTPLYGKKKRL